MVASLWVEDPGTAFPSWSLFNFFDGGSEHGTASQAGTKVMEAILNNWLSSCLTFMTFDVEALGKNVQKNLEWQISFLKYQASISNKFATYIYIRILVGKGLISPGPRESYGVSWSI